MILITGGTGFIGQALIRHMNELGVPVRILVRPSSQTPNLPRGVPVEVAVSSLSDPRSLRAAMVGVVVVYHLISAEWRGPQASLMDIDITGTQAVLQAAVDAGVDRLVTDLGIGRNVGPPLCRLIPDEVVGLARQLVHSFDLRLRVGANQFHLESG